MSQSPLSRAIRELERDLGVVLFVRTTRRVELTAAGSMLLERSRRALAEIDGAVADARRAADSDGNTLAVVHGPFSGAVVARIVGAVKRECPGLSVRVAEDVTPGALRRVGANELEAAVVMESRRRTAMVSVWTRSGMSRSRPRCRSRTEMPPRKRSRSASSWPSACCCRVSRRARCSMPRCGALCLRMGLSSGRRWRRPAPVGSPLAASRER